LQSNQGVAHFTTLGRLRSTFGNYHLPDSLLQAIFELTKNNAMHLTSCLSFLMVTLTGLCLSFTLNGQVQQNTLKIKLSGNGFSDETIIRYIPLATDTFDANFDAWKLFSANPAVPSIYTAGNSGSYAINSMSLPNKDLNKSMALILPDSGQYDLEFTEMHAFDTSCILVVEDLLTNHFQNIRLYPNYTFQAQGSSFPSTVSNRFKIHVYLPPAINITQPECAGDLATTVVSKPGNVDWSYQLHTTDGHLVGSQTPFQTSTNLAELQPGDYQLVIGYPGGNSHTAFFHIESGKHIAADFSMAYTSSKPMKGEKIQFTNLAPDIDEVWWSFGDEQRSSIPHPTHIYEHSGKYEVSMLIAYGECKDTVNKTIEIDETTGTISRLEKQASIYYNNSSLQVNSENRGKHIYKVILYSLSGKTLMERELSGGVNTLSIPVPAIHQQMVICMVYFDNATAMHQKLFLP
jgi:hypothetical protein